MSLKRIALFILLAFSANSVSWVRPAQAIEMNQNTRTVFRTAEIGAIGGGIVGVAMLPFAGTGARGVFVGASVGLYLGIAVGFFLVSERRDAEHNPTRAEIEEIEKMEKTPQQLRPIAEVALPVVRF